MEVEISKPMQNLLMSVVRMANLSSGMNDFDLFIMLLNNIHFYIAKKLHYNYK